MMKLVTAAQMKAIDSRAIHEWQIPELILMENAGLAVVGVLKDKFPDLTKMNVTIVAGSGNNGGDGLVIARHLYNMGVAVKVFLLTERDHTESARVNLAILEKMAVKLYRIDNENSLHLFKATLNYTDIVIDAILGTGVNRPVSDMVSQVLGIINKRSCVKVAVDLPTGLNADTGEIWGSVLKADLTVTLALPKRGLLLNDGLSAAGEVIVADIGIPQAVVDAEAVGCTLLDAHYLESVLRPRERDSHKGRYGHLLTIGGSLGMSGGIALANNGALRAGAGVLTCAVPEKIYLPVAVQAPEVMVHPLPDAGTGFLHAEGMPQLLALLKDKDAVVIGPGLGHQPGMTELLAEIVQSVTCPLVIDADGLNLLAGHLDILDKASQPIIITPHPGEMARLTGMTTAQIQSSRLTVAQDFARAHGVWVVLKGAYTVIASPEGELWVNEIDSPALAMAGSGDVLSGILGALAAQGYAPSEVCTAAVNLHGQAGVLLQETVGAVSSRSGDLMEAITNIIRGVLS